MTTAQQIVLAMSVSESDFEFASLIETAIATADDELEVLDETVQSVDLLKPSCDKLDYALAASSGTVCGLMDIFLIGKPGESPVGNIGDTWFKNRVTDFAKLCGWKPEDTESAIAFLEDKFDVPYDQTGRDAAREIYNLTPGNHHFKALGHNPTLLGLFFSILDQFTNQSHFVAEGELIALQDADRGFELHGNSVPAKFICGFANWFGHLISDMSGSSGSKGRGMGIPSPFWAWTNDIVALKRTLGISTSTFNKNVNDLALKIYEQGYDARFQAIQAIPVFVNEVIVRLLYATRRLVKYLGNTEDEVRSFSETWKACEPFSNPTVKRMLTVAHGAFCMLNVGDATIQAFAAGGTFNTPEFFMRLNIVGIGRFTISLYGEAERAVSIRGAQASAQLALREKTIVEDYLFGLSQLADLYNDKYLVCLVEDFRKSDMFIRAFGVSVQLANLRKVPDDKVLRTKSDIDTYFAGGKK